MRIALSKLDCGSLCQILTNVVRPHHSQCGGSTFRLLIKALGPRDVDSSLAKKIPLVLRKTTQPERINYPREGDWKACCIEQLPHRSTLYLGASLTIESANSTLPAAAGSGSSTIASHLMYMSGTDFASFQAVILSQSCASPISRITTAKA